MKKLLALLLALLMCAAVLVACNNDSEKNKNENVENNGNGETNGEEEVDPNRPEVKDLEGYEFIIKNDAYCDFEFAAPEELNGEGINDAVYNRNKTVEALYNITIKETGDPGASDQYSFLQQMKASQEHFADLYSHDAGKMIARYATAGFFLNVYDLDSLRLDREYWDQEFLAETTLNKHAYTLTGDIQTNDDLHEYSLVMNRTKFNQVFPDKNLYDLVVKDGTWTLETFFNIWESYPAYDGGVIGSVDSDDVIGYGWDGKSATFYFISCNLPSFQMENGKPNLDNIESTKAYNIVDYLKRIHAGKNGMYSIAASGGVDSNYRITHENACFHFAAGKMLVNSNLLGDALGYYLDMPDDVVYLPFPKYDTAQIEYYTPVHWCFEPLAFPITVEDEEKSALITESLAYHSDELETEVMDVLLQERLSSEAESRGILQTTLRSKKYDMDYIATVTGFTAKVDSLLVYGQLNNYASTITLVKNNAVKTNGKGSLQRFLKSYAGIEP